MTNDIEIIVATHTKCPMPDDKMYYPLYVGAANKSDEELSDWNYGRDDIGDNISKFNPVFGTQTGLYWIWKNSNAEYKGLVHYRRFFVGRKKYIKKNYLKNALKYDELKQMLSSYTVFTPRKRFYLIETVYSHYAHTHNENHLLTARKIIQADTPDYIRAFDVVLNRRWGYMFNMMIIRKDLLDDYCKWLFKILFKMNKEVDTSEMSDYDRRFCGRVSEILFNVWLENRVENGVIKRSDIKELAYWENVDWMFKIKAFFMAKYMNKKYERSS